MSGRTAKRGVRGQLSLTVTMTTPDVTCETGTRRFHVR
jgi:hypothetical protein